MLNNLQETLVTNANSEHYDLLGYPDAMSDSHGSWSSGYGVGQCAPGLAMNEIATRCSWVSSPTHILLWDHPTSSFGESISVRYLNDLWRSQLVVYRSIQGGILGGMVPIDPDWLVMAYRAVDELSLSDIEVIVDGLTKVLSSGRFAEVDISLSGADPSRMTADAIVAIAHMTFPAKSNLHAWQDFVDRSRAALTERGDEEDHLEGLD